ncbi:hypothetical protein [Luteimonas vadosa]|uniref:Uncharacterized protein n=1 Tax=Luteimonas vadosa TaxID=1165507 RepID=A0ABP9DYK9_9GAMM
MEKIPIEDLALLEILQRIDQAMPLRSGDTEIHERLVESGLVEVVEGGTCLTPAGVEMCKSLQHRQAADAQVEKVMDKRNGDGAGASTASDGGNAAYS